MEVWLSLFGGLALLVIGGELLVRGAVQIASKLGVSPLVIGLTLVGFGTSTPELVTSVQGALNGSPGIAYGNIVGSNIANILLILGACAMLWPIHVTSGALKRDGVVMISVGLIFALVSATMPMTALIGGCFVIALVLYVALAFRQERAATADNHGAVYDKSLAMQAADPVLAVNRKTRVPITISLLIVAFGLGIVVLGGYFLVGGAVSLARSFGISETIIGLTIVAVGTSMPELVTSLVAAVRKESEVAFGNVVGSNIYNILGIGGITALIAPIQLPEEIVRFDNPVMIGASVLVVALAYSGRRIARWEGGLLLSGYIAYVAWIWP